MFGGVHGDYTDQTYVVHEDLEDFKKSYIKASTKHKQSLRTGDKFYYQ